MNLLLFIFYYLYNKKYYNGNIEDLSAGTVRNIHFVIHNTLEYAVKWNLGVFAHHHEKGE
jgi:hypothetical protein